MSESSGQHSIFGSSAFRERKPDPERLPPVQPESRRFALQYVPDFWRAMQEMRTSAQRRAPERVEDVRRAHLRGNLAVSEVLETALAETNRILASERTYGPPGLRDALLTASTRFRTMGAHLVSVQEKIEKTDGFRREETVYVYSTLRSRRFASEAENATDGFRRALSGALADIFSLYPTERQGAERAGKTLILAVTGWIAECEHMFRRAASLVRAGENSEIMTFLKKRREDQLQTGRRILEQGIFQEDLYSVSAVPTAWVRLVQRAMREVPHRDHRDIELEAIDHLFPAVFTPRREEQTKPFTPDGIRRIASLFGAHGIRNGEEQSIVQSLRWWESLVRSDHWTPISSPLPSEGYLSTLLSAAGTPISGRTHIHALALSDALVSRLRSTLERQCERSAREILDALTVSAHEHPRTWVTDIAEAEIAPRRATLDSISKDAARRRVQAARDHGHAIIIKLGPELDADSTD